MKKIIIIAYMKNLVCCTFCYSNKADNQQNDARAIDNELYNLIDGIEYNDNLLSHYTDLNWLTENPHPIEKQLHNDITVYSDTNNFGIGYQHEGFPEVGIKRKYIMENGQFENENSGYTKLMKRQQINNDEIAIDIRHPEDHLLAEEMYNISNILTSEGYFPSLYSNIISDYTEFNVHLDDLAVFNALVRLTKNIIYYRLNIAKFFSVFKSKIHLISSKPGYSLSKAMFNKSMIELFIQFAENNRNNVYPEVCVKIKKEIIECKLYECMYIKLLKTKKVTPLLSNSIEYKKIKEYNQKYIVDLHTELGAISEFHPLYYFLDKVLMPTVDVFKYYNMLADFLGSLYDISLIVKNNFKKIQKLIDLDKTIFEVHYCTCREQTKETFIFHWVVCWITYFSRCCMAPLFINKHADMCTIDAYPTEFFVQFIILLYYNMSFDDDNTQEKFLDKNYINFLKENIIELLHSDTNQSNMNFMQHTIYNLYSEVKGIHSTDLFQYTTVKNIRMLQTREEHIILSRKLIPVLEKFVKVLFGVAIKSFELTNIERSQS